MYSISSFTSPRMLLSLAIAKQSGKFPTPQRGETRTFVAIALTDAIPMSTDQFKKWLGETDPTTTYGGKDITGRLIVKARIVKDESGVVIESLDNPHIMYDDPCDYNESDQTEFEKALGIIATYPTFITAKDFSLTDDATVRKNDQIFVTLRTDSTGHIIEDNGFIVGVFERAGVESAGLTPCQSMADRFKVDSPVCGTFGATPGPAPYQKGTIEMQSIWTATPTTSTRDDATFCKGACPGALTGYYKSLSKYNTSFLKYKESDVIDLFKKISGYEEYVKVAAYAYMYKEQPPEGGMFSFPNNNVAGIQTDLSSQQAGLSTSDIDFQTCFKDAETWRAFAGFTTLDRGLTAYLDTIKARFASTWSDRIPSGTPDEYATQLTDNYFQGWNVIASDTELESIKKNGSFTRDGITYKRGYTSAKSGFLTRYKEYTGLK